ncbi:hypothetical protein MXL20_10965 [Staphylococcus pseudoxylosus]|uniref:hypothetical protein n=2 Tax=Staphylococcus pseudoxylosus TaxID=2282419 RepID=UPI000F522D6F|nr:hypothetical protein [Staphylococcus pseudoxylosus]MEB6333498.1 hypothetical protein [Staphylococcus pseudoxylosus]RQM86309.1 hypothetical protein CO206_01580 [Staphylococcus xylosus]
MNIDMNNPVCAIQATLKYSLSQSIVGDLILLSDRIYFKTSDGAKLSNFKDELLFSDIKNIKMGLTLTGYRIVIMDLDGEPWVFNSINRKKGKHFIELYNEIQ